ncbi:MAG: mechanosensitive ion channel family protein [Saprospiraceae bacterium]|nr:mechanosensitive ion channel family protein [Saprospiraceae bacterium]
MDIFTNESWFYWALGLMIVTPLSILLLNEAIRLLQRKHQGIIPPINQLKNVVLPLFAFSFLIRYVSNSEINSFFLKILDTISWMFLISSVLTITNIVLFETAGVSSWRSKVPKLFLDLFKVVLILVGGAIILSNVWGADLSNLATALGLGSFVLGLALQDTLGNLFSGIALFYEKPFKMGDNIKVGEHSGKIIELNWRAVRIITPQEEMIVVPHLVIGKEAIINFSQPTTYYIHKINVSFSYNDPPNKVKEVLFNVCLDIDGILKDPEPEIKTVKYGDSGIEYEIEFAIAEYNDFEATSNGLMTSLWYAAKRHSLTMPLPQRVVFNGEQQQAEALKNTPSIEKVLAELSSIIPIDKAKVGDLADGIALQYYGKGETILIENDINDCLFIVIEGKVEESAHNINGDNIKIAKYSRGDFFGENALLGAKPNPATIKAITDLQTIIIYPDEVTEMLEKNPQLAIQLDEILETRQILRSQLMTQTV